MESESRREKVTSESKFVYYSGESYEQHQPAPEIPRSLSAHEAGVSGGSVLPRSGEEVLPHIGKHHPLVDLLLEKRPSSPMTSVIRAEHVPRSETETLPTPPSPQMTAAGLQEPAPSPVSSVKTPTEISPGPLPVQSEGRKVLFIYPPALSDDAVLKGLRHAYEMVLKPNDRLVFLWAGLQDWQMESQSSPGAGRGEPEVFTVGESMSPDEQDIKVWGESFNQVAAVLREKTPILHNLISSHLLKGHAFEVRIHSQSSIWDSLKAEFKNKNAFQLVLMPSFPPENDPNKSLEDFILKNSPAPVAFIRI